MNVRLLGAVALLVPLAAISGCGYTAQTSLDPKYQSIAVAAFYDKTREYDLQAPLTNAVIRKFMNDGRLEVVPADEADLLLEGVILEYQRKGLITDANDEVTQFILTIAVGVRVTDLDTDEVLWEEPRLGGQTTYYTRASGQSSDRLRGNAETFLPTVRSFASEEENRAASEALERIASDIFYRTIDPW